MSPVWTAPPRACCSAWSDASPMLAQQQARHLQLAAQGLLTPPPARATRAALRRAIERMQLLQIDTIHVVARSPYLVLHARMGHYPQDWLDEALAQAHIFETWAHEACFAPACDMALHRSYNATARYHWGILRGQASHAQQRKQLDALLAHVQEKGPVKSSDFARTDGKASGGWWGWKDEKRWLEALFATGELMVARRENFHRVYDLPERVHPGIGTLPVPNASEVHEQFIERAIAALGVTQARWVHDYFRIKPRVKDADLDDLVAQGRLLRIDVEGWEAPGYVHARHKALLKKACVGQLAATHSALLSPFDPIVWDRERARVMFDFDYTLECYTPEAKRVYGYFVLPILLHGALIGRLDAKAHRDQGVFEVRALHLQEGVKLNAGQVLALAQLLHHTARWHGTPEVSIAGQAPKALRNSLSKAVRLLAD